MSADKTENVFIVWEVATRCNLACTYCHVRGKEDGMAAADLLTAIQRLGRSVFKGHNLTVFWTGGEPTLRPEVVMGLSKTLTDNSVSLGLCTNGTRLADQDLCRHICQYYSKVTVSVDVPGGADVLRRGADSDVVWRGIGELTACKASCETPVISVAVTLSKANIHRFYDLCDVAEDHGVQRIELRPLQCGPDDVEKRQYALDVTDIDAIRSIADMRDAPGRRLFIDVPDAYIDRICRYVEGSLNEYSGCLAGRSVLFVDSKGDVYPCCSFFPRKNPLALEDVCGMSPLSLQQRMQSTVLSTRPNNCSRCLDMANLSISTKTSMLPLNSRAGR